MKRKLLIYGIGGAAALFVVVLASWMTVEMTIEITSHADFCGQCHSTMGPMVESYLASTHGGNNSHGVMAPCTDCHVSHDSLPAHVIGKAQSGSHDVWVQLTRHEDDFDWEATRLRREEYVYDSGCVTCHRNLQEATMLSNKAFVAHKPYFLGETEDQCVTCHEHVGHKNLSDYIAKSDQ